MFSMFVKITIPELNMQIPTILRNVFFNYPRVFS